MIVRFLADQWFARQEAFTYLRFAAIPVLEVCDLTAPKLPLVDAIDSFLYSDGATNPRICV